jgi:hypothetical protein
LEANILTLDLLERPNSSEALTNTRWRAAAYEPRIASHFTFTDISSIARRFMVPFGPVSLVFAEPPAAWFNNLLAEISQIGDLKENWDSYGARPIDPRCAEAAANLLWAVLDSSTPKPFVVPTSRGGIQLEWHRAGVDLELEIESPARVNVCFEDHREGTEQEITLSGDLRPLTHFLKRLGEAD